MNNQILQACKELIDDAKACCADLVFKEMCLEILSKARLVLTETQFSELVEYATKRIKENVSLELAEGMLSSM
ncbi:MAG: hypothetical protein N3F10_05950 [Candidatus Bathyarchaeota archaeon]|nr:hypothetical protein [Candidatus Bathyarchaeota archaeon]MCX8177819.1 hypothetical protein [Candidatus Bathyarchaeota archaeon]MDW8194419.1 hypothetical protein [Nitrososphaerota archaeon]